MDYRKSYRIYKIAVWVCLVLVLFARLAEILWMGMAGIAVHFQNIFICDQSHREIVEFRHFPTDDQRRTENTPQRHHGNLLVLCEFGTEGRIIILLDRSDRQHVCIRPASVAGVDTPFSGTVKHLIKLWPGVPEIISDTPHIGCLFVKLCLF